MLPEMAAIMRSTAILACQSAEHAALICIALTALVPNTCDVVTPDAALTLQCRPPARLNGARSRFDTNWSINTTSASEFCPTRASRW